MSTVHHGDPFVDCVGWSPPPGRPAPRKRGRNLPRKGSKSELRGLLRKFSGSSLEDTLFERMKGYLKLWLENGGESTQFAEEVRCLVSSVGQVQRSISDILGKLE